MGYIYSGSNTTLPIGKVMDYNNTNPASGVAAYRMLGPTIAVSSAYPEKSGFSENFSLAIYGEGPYRLLHPNSLTNEVANNLDLLA